MEIFTSTETIANLGFLNSTFFSKDFTSSSIKILGIGQGILYLRGETKISGTGLLDYSK